MLLDPLALTPFRVQSRKGTNGEKIEGKPMGAVSAFTGRYYQPQPIQKREKEKRKRRREEKSETNIIQTSRVL